jgi:hypothetical protein
MTLVIKFTKDFTDKLNDKRVAWDSFKVYLESFGFNMSMLKECKLYEGMMAFNDLMSNTDYATGLYKKVIPGKDIPLIHFIMADLDRAINYFYAIDGMDNSATTQFIESIYKEKA